MIIKRIGISAYEIRDGECIRANPYDKYGFMRSQLYVIPENIIERLILWRRGYLKTESIFGWVYVKNMNWGIA